jgi:carboxypeptidase PM20D1
VQPVERFQELLRIPTVHPGPGDDADWSAHERFAARLEDLYPRVHRALDREPIGRSLLYRWPGDGSTSTGPIVLMAHFDVVPAADEASWTYPPFAATITGSGEDRLIWGRGTLDDKGPLVAILEAVEGLLEEGFQPDRDVYLSFGHDEESYGTGAQQIAATLEARGIRPSLVLDEGGAIVRGVFPGVTAPIAAVGVSEKGIADVVLTVAQAGGHASTPPKLAATVRIARAVARLNARQFPARLNPVTRAMLSTVGAHAPGALGVALRNLRSTAPLVTRVLTRLTDETRAMVRSTMAITQLSGSAASNVLAERATATVNVRIAIGSSVAEAREHVRAAIGDAGIEVRVEHASEPSPISPMTGPTWQRVAAAVRAVAPEAVPTPYVMMAASDARHFTGISDAVYRFMPFELSAEERATLHAIDERLGVATWLRGIRFYREIVAPSAG